MTMNEQLAKYPERVHDEETAQDGMSLRAYIATQQMAAIVSAGGKWGWGLNSQADQAAMAERAVKLADALIEELSK